MAFKLNLSLNREFLFRIGVAGVSRTHDHTVQQIYISYVSSLCVLFLFRCSTSIAFFLIYSAYGENICKKEKNTNKMKQSYYS